MDLSFGPEQLALRDEIVRFARSELNSDLISHDRDEVFPRENWAKCAQFGIPGLPFPKEYGGSEADIVSTMLAMEGLGYGCRDAGLIFGLNAQMWAVQMPIWLFGTEEQKRRYLPPLCSGERLGAHGMTEPDSGSDAMSLSTTAVRRGDAYVLNGAKTFVTNAPVADVFVVFASTDSTKGFLGVSAFVVERDRPGITTQHISKMGLR
jgi:alkylation response protein AidB-like acyl-CoA dehydrogenase